MHNVTKKDKQLKINWKKKERKFILSLCGWSEKNFMTITALAFQIHSTNMFQYPSDVHNNAKYILILFNHNDCISNLIHYFDILRIFGWRWSIAEINDTTVFSLYFLFIKISSFFKQIRYLKSHLWAEIIYHAL